MALGSDGGLLMENPPCCCWPGAAAPPAEAEEMGASARAMLPSGAYLRGRPRFLRIRSPMPSTLPPGAPGAPAPAADCGGGAYSMGAAWWWCSVFPAMWSNERRMPPGMGAPGDGAGAACCCANGGGGGCWCCCCGGGIEDGGG